MLAGTRHHTRTRRGIVLVLVLAMLSLLALIGVTFATFSGQARINARNYAQSVIRPTDDELMDFALQQLITDTNDPRSVIRGHSLAQDMYGNDAGYNGYFPIHPTYGTPFSIASMKTTATPGVYTVTTNIQSNDSNFYGYIFTRWIMRVTYTGTLTPNPVTLNSPVTLSGTTSPAQVPAVPVQPVSQTWEIIGDTQFQYTTNAPRVFTVVLLEPNPLVANSTDDMFPNPNSGATTNLINWGFQAFSSGGTQTQTATASQLPSYYLSQAAGNIQFALDGRWLNAFNGPGMGTQYNTVTINYQNYSNLQINVPYSAYGNFRYNGLVPGAVGMDEDYDACDLENWFLALQSADGQVMIPSFHRPGIVRYQDSIATTNKFDWDPGFRQANWVDSASRILRPVAADGHDPSTFPDLVPDGTGKITYDVDNDGDGVTDSVWLDLGYPPQRDAAGNYYKPLFAFMVIGLNGRIPLNTAGNLAGSIASLSSNGANTPSSTNAGAGPTHSQHLGNSVSEIDPSYGLQNAYQPYNTAAGTGDYDPFNQYANPNNGTVFAPPATWGTLGATTSGSYTTFNAQVDNAINAVGNSNNAGVYQSVDVRLTQLRNLLAGTRPQSGAVVNGTPLNPYTNPDTTGTFNGDTNLVWGSWPGYTVGHPYYLPNGIADGSDVIPQGYTWSTTDPNDANNSLTFPLVQRTTPPVGGRWGEAASVNGVGFANPNAPPAYLNLVQYNYANPVRAGMSFNASDMLTYLVSGNVAYDANGDIVFPSDIADDNYNAFDVYPTRLTGEIYDADFYDPAMGLMLPVERMRRFVTPVDINGTGRVQTWNSTHDYGPDNFGRVQFSSYFRPAGVAGVINTNTTGTGTLPYGAIAYGTWNSGAATPWTLNTASSAIPSTATYQPDVTNNPLHGYEFFKLPNQLQVAGGVQGTGGVAPANSNGIINANANPVGMGGMPIDQNPLQYTATGATSPSPTNYPGWFNTYDNKVNSSLRLDGVNEADEMNLYVQNPLLDSPYGPSDLEWLYRQQDVDGASLTSRLSSLAPVSFTNTIDGQRRRRLYALDSWELNNYVWANDNPGNAFANNSRFVVGQNASFLSWAQAINSTTPPAYLQTSTSTSTSTGSSSVLTPLFNPSLAYRNKKINLNYPLPVSNDPNEPVRQKWISETYEFLKAILPPTSVDSPEELAQLSQYVVNIIDFRDPDATMTHFANPDVWITPGTQQTSNAVYTNPNYYTYPILTIGPATTGTAGAVATGCIPLDQFGMEYNPVAINEVLAYAVESRTSTATASSYYSRFFIELVNTLTAAYNPTFDTANIYDQNNYYGYGPVPGAASNPTYGNTTGSPGPGFQASAISLGGFSYAPGNPYSGGCWDLVFTADNAMARPDPYRGDLLNIPTPASGAAVTTYYSLMPLNRDGVTGTVGGGVAGGNNTNLAAPNGGDVTLIPLTPNATAPMGYINAYNSGYPASQQFSPFQLPTSSTYIATGAPPINYFYVIGSQTNSGESNSSSLGPQYGNALPSPVTQYFSTAYDPMTNGGIQPTGFVWFPGILPGVQGTATTGYTAPANYSWDFPNFGTSSGSGPGGGGTGGTGTGNTPATGTAQYFWVCLRRPANPFAPVSATNPMCVVDSMRFPYIDGSYGLQWGTPNPTTGQWTPSGTPNTIYSAQRLQPYRGGHAVPMPNTPATASTNTQGAVTTTMPPDPRYGYSDQIAVPQTYNSSLAPSVYGLANTSAGATSGPPSSNYYFHTLGYNNDSAENWDYFVFNDRDFSSVAELMLVPGCPPGLFTKQFVEFAASQLNAQYFFGQVTPVLTPSSNNFPLAVSGGVAQPNTLPVQTGTVTNTTGSTNYLAADLPLNAFGTPTGTYNFATATLPFLSLSQGTTNSQIGNSPPSGSSGLPAAVPTNLPTLTYPTTINGTATTLYYLSTYQSPPSYQVPVEPHAFPYLVDKFFYTGASTFFYPPSGAQLDPGSPTNGNAAIPVVGGPGGDGWFKMMEFFEVPSQMIGAVGPVFQGANFDWARQDIKPGLMNLNLIVDEEAFFSIFGRQSTSGFNQSLLNSFELPLLLNPAGVLPYTLPLATTTGNNGAPPIPLGYPPVPLVVSAIQPTGAPNYVYPITQQNLIYPQGYLAIDPIQQQINNYLVANGATTPLPSPVGNRIKAAFAQFLWARHGGSGYLFAHGIGATGQNFAVAPSASSTPNLPTVFSPIPADFPFRSLSYPDINYTIMRPAATPPSTLSNPATLSFTSLTNVPTNAATNAAAVTYSPTQVPTTWYFLNPNYLNPLATTPTPNTLPNYYAPYVATSSTAGTATITPSTYFGENVPIIYTGDPGVRNPYLNQGYVPGAFMNPSSPLTQLGATAPYPVYSPSGVAETGSSVTNSTNTVLAGMPLPVNVAFPTTSTTAPVAMDSVVMPQPIPPARLFQIPDAFGAGQVDQAGGGTGYVGISWNGTQAVGTVPPAVSHATDSGDPWINNFVANQYLNPYLTSGAGVWPPTYSMTNPPTYTLNNGFNSLMWPSPNNKGQAGGIFYANGSATAPLLSATGVLPPTTIASPPYGITTNPATGTTYGPLSVYNGYGSAPNNTNGPYLGDNTTGTSSNLTDDRQHPYWRSELIQKAMNLTTVRTHQYAVWITIGFFEIKRQGDIGMLAQGAAQLAFDIMGPEVGALNGENVRYRGFFLVDRLQLTGFNPGNVGAFHSAVMYRKMIQ